MVLIAHQHDERRSEFRQPEGNRHFQ